MRKLLYKVIFEHDTRAGRIFDLVLLWLILFSVTVVIIESIPKIHEAYFHTFYTLEWVLTILFSIEYLLRIWTSPKPLKYIFSFWGLIDFLSIMPTYIGIFVSGYHYLLTIRIFRLLRVFRILKLARFNREAQLLFRSLQASSYKIGIFLLAVISIVTLLGTLMYVIEGSKSGFTSIPQSIYWAIVTVTTVGFGDIVPQTVLGKFISSVAMILGYSIIAVPTGIITVALSAKKASVKSCEICGNKNPEDSLYCNRCGNRLSNQPENLPET